jgi:ribosome maturation factor RimP
LKRKGGLIPPFLLPHFDEKMLTSEQISDIIKELLDPERHFLVDLKVSTSRIRNKITVLIDTDIGIGIDECSRISRELANLLEEKIDEAYTLEVSSPGLDTPLKINRQYLKNFGRKLKVTLLDGSTLVGKLITASEKEIVILPEKKKKEKITPEEITLAFENIKEARVQVSFN